MRSISEPENARKVFERMFPADPSCSNAATLDSSSGYSIGYSMTETKNHG